MAATALSQTLQGSPHDFLTPSSSLHADALAQIASALRPVAASVQALHDQRTAEHRRKRKRGQDYDDDALLPWDEKEALRLGNVHVDGFAVEQIWEQVRRVVEGIGREVRRDLAIKAARTQEIEEEEDDESVLGEEGLDYEIEGMDDDEDARPSDDEDEEDLSEEEEDEDEDMEDEEDDLEDEELDEEEGSDDEAEVDTTQTAEFVPDANGLNDGFFSIDDFNKQSAFLEQADARGGDDGAASDEEEVDWNMDPMKDAATANIKSRRPT